MRSLLIAQRPALRPRTVLPAVDDVDAHPLPARLVGIGAANNDRGIGSLAPALRETR